MWAGPKSMWAGPGIVQEFRAQESQQTIACPLLLLSLCPAFFSSLCSHLPFCSNLLLFLAWCRVESCVGLGGIFSYRKTPVRSTLKKS